LARRRDVARHPSSDGCMICTISISWPCRLPIDRMPAIERPAIDADRCVVTAMLDDLLRAVVMESAQTLQLTKPKRIDVTSVRNDWSSCDSEPAFLHIRHTVCDPAASVSRLLPKRDCHGPPRHVPFLQRRACRLVNRQNPAVGVIHRFGAGKNSTTQTPPTEKQTTWRACEIRTRKCRRKLSL
jgi:hypothetical protein